MTYNVFSGTLNPTQSINQSCACFYHIRDLRRANEGVEGVEQITDHTRPGAGAIAPYGSTTDNTLQTSPVFSDCECILKRVSTDLSTFTGLASCVSRGCK